MINVARPRVSTSIAVLARLVLAAVSKIAQEGKYKPRFPKFSGMMGGYSGYDRINVYKAFVTCTELCKRQRTSMLTELMVVSTTC
jgi:hypothetical protein